MRHLARLLPSGGMWTALVAATALLVFATPASAAGMTRYDVPTGGFSLALPAHWISLAGASAATVKKLAKSPGFAAFLAGAESDPKVRMVGVDPAKSGTVYMDAGVARVGAITLPALANGLAAEIRKAVGAKVPVSVTAVNLPVGAAYRLDIIGSGAKAIETTEYLFLHNQVEYVLDYLAPRSSWGAVSASFAASADSFKLVAAPDLTGTVLTGSQVGKGYKQAAFPGGLSFIGETTLDLCGQSYASEVLRTGRLQVRYTHTGAAVAVSNEVVTYVPNGAQLALSEVAKVALSCAKKPVVQTGKTTDGKDVTSTYSVTAIKASGLLPGAIAVTLEVSLVEGKQKLEQQGIAIYQVKGNTLSGVYTYVRPGTTLADATRVGLQAARASAKRLAGTILAA